MAKLYKLPSISLQYSLPDFTPQPDGQGVPVFNNYELMENAFVDASALEGLSRLINGEVRGWADIRNAELCLRAFVFHDRVSSIRPEYQVHRIHSADDKTPIGAFDREHWKQFRGAPLDGVELVPEPISGLDTLDPLLSTAKFSAHFHTLDWRLATFSSEEVRLDHIKARERADKNSLQEKTVFSINGLAGPVEELCDTEEIYFEKQVYSNESKVRELISELPITGSALYLGHQKARTLFDVHVGNYGGSFFKSLDIEWNQTFEAMARSGLNIPVPPLVLIVLSRATRRDEIISEALLLREAFESARRQLWQLFAEIQRAPSLVLQERLSKHIEKDAGAIVKTALAEREMWLPKLLQFPIRLLVNGIVGALGWQEAIEKVDGQWPFESFGSQIHYLDAARIMVREIAQAESMHLALRKHLSDGELMKLDQHPATRRFFDEPPVDHA